MSSIQHYFASLADPRQAINQEHRLLDIVVIAICAIIAGADDWEAVADFGRTKVAGFQRFLASPHGIPAHDTFWRVFRVLEPEGFQTCFLTWIQAVSDVTHGQVVAIDGKKLRRSPDKGLGKQAIHRVSAWASANGLTLGQRKVDDKSRPVGTQITAIPALLDVLDLTGCIVTIDAMAPSGHPHTAIAQAIVDKDADYVLALKANQDTLYEDVTLLFDDLVQSRYTAYPYDHAKTVDKDHRRIEVRQAWTITDPSVLRDLRTTAHWPQLQTLVKVQAERQWAGQQTVETRYSISSLRASATTLLTAVRTHWHIENCCHWVLDMAFREDECRLRKDHDAQNFAILRHIALNCLKQERSVKLGLKNKRLRAGWDTAYLFTALSTLFP